MGNGATGGPDTGVGDLARLGIALTRCAADVAALVLQRARPLLDGYDGTVGQRIGDDILRTCSAGTGAVAHVMATGRGLTPAAWRELAGAGRSAAADGITLGDMTKLYFMWRDVTIEVVRRLAADDGAADDELARAEAIVRAGCDSSLVRMAKEFDLKRHELKDQLASDQARLAYLARHDSLTGLPNRLDLIEQLGQVVDSCRTGTGAAVLFVDLNGFKTVNDLRGHAVGDELLARVAQRIREVVRPADMVSRFGGDEFVVVCRALPDAEHDARAVAHRIHDALDTPFDIGGEQFSASASIGITVVEPGDDPDRVLMRADAAMYAAKGQPRVA